MKNGTRMNARKKLINAIGLFYLEDFRGSWYWLLKWGSGL